MGVGVLSVDFLWIYMCESVSKVCVCVCMCVWVCVYMCFKVYMHTCVCVCVLVCKVCGRLFCLHIH